MKNIIILLNILTLWQCTDQKKSISFTNKDENAIRLVLKNQIDQWNAGSIDGFMNGYWKDTALSFCTQKGETKGWDSVCARYKRSYNTKAKMGNLQFKNVTIFAFRNTELAQSNGTWEVIHNNDTASGKFCLFWKKFDSEWKIVDDHTW